MSIKKANITIKGIKDGKEKKIYSTKWDGDLGEWMGDIGGEFAGAIADDKDYDEIIMSAKSINRNNKNRKK